ncbi:MAG: right-handed parallel beta-helix repeat-containing protein [Candidatus Marinimicrobia bacterium]|nr:right-handed parallel beta-helix repeat-containing protein [Candidatus Neomarinimicrobiota bacterium]
MVLEISYDYLNPNYYVINRSGSNKYFILENRLRDGFDYYTPNDPDYPGEPEDPNGNEGGLLIWRVEPTWIHLLLADNEKSDLYPDIEGENRSYSQDPFPLYQGQRVNYNTSPNSRFRDNSDSHYAFQNIVWDDDNKAATADIYTNAWTGEIEENTTWDGDVFVYGNVTVSPNVELTIVPGVKIKFDSGVRLTVEGKLTAHGTSDNPIVFTSSKSNPSPGSWYGIVVEDGGEIELNHAKVGYATYGVKSSYADVELKDSEFVRNKWGCRLYHSDGAVIDDCVFSDNYYYGALLSYSSNVNIEDSDFKNTSLYHGLYLNKSTVRIANSRIEGNHGDGIFVYNQGNLDMSTDYEKGRERVNNVISNNGIYGIYISYNSTANLGTYLDIVTDILGGFNHFSHISENYDVYNSNTATVKAEVNWWDDMNIFGNVDYTPTAEDLGYYLSKELANTGEDEKVGGLLLEAYRLEYVDSSYAEAIRKLDEVVDFVYDNDYSYEVVSSYVRLYGKLGDMEGLEEKLRGLHDRYGSSVIGLASYSYLVTVLSGMKRFEEAVGACDDVIGIYDRLGGHEEEIAGLLFERMEIERDMSSVLGKAVDSDSYRELMERYSDTEAARLAREIYGGEVGGKEVAKLPEEYRLREPYPNPFNSSVVIGFDLPEAGKVELRIYDVLGREVYGKIKEYAAGEYSVIWDGRSSKGLEVPSGVYIVVMKAGRYVGVKKVVLMRERTGICILFAFHFAQSFCPFRRGVRGYTLLSERLIMKKA